MARFYMLVFLIQLVLVIVALISCLSAEDGEVRALPRFAWVVIILLFPLVGPIVYLAVGRPVKASAGGSWAPGSGFPESSRPKRALAPDDDPEFLSKINEQSRREDQELLRKWEEDLRKREDELRKQDDTPPTDG